MKVLMINSVCGIRSTGRICTDLADVLQAKGHECKIVYGREEVPDKYKQVADRIGSEIDVKINGILSRIFDNEGFNAKKQTEELIVKIDRYKPDVIHLHNLHGYYINIDILMKYLTKINKPVVWTMHDCWPITGHCAHFANIKCEKWKTGCHNCKNSKKYPRSVLIDSSRKNWNCKKNLFLELEQLFIVTPSEWLAGVMRQSFLNAYPICSIPNGVDLEVFKPTESDFRERYRLEGKKIVLGVASAWGKNKGLYELIQLQKVLGDSYQVVLVGLTKKLLDKLPAEIIGVEQTNNVQELAGLYTMANVFVNAGQQETMGLTTVEAMACGTPVVVSNLTAVPEVVDPESGLIFDKYTVSCIADNVRKVVSSSKWNPRRGALNYEKKKQYERYLHLYQEITQ